MKSLDKKIIEKIIASFQNNPEDWIFFMHYTAENPKEEIKVWLCNGIDSLSIEIKGHKIGGLSPLSMIFGYLIPWRRKVWKIFKSAQTAYLKEHEEKPKLQEIEAWVNKPILEIVRH